MFWLLCWAVQGNREDEDGPPNLQDLGPDGTPLAEVSALRSKLWELVSGIPPEQVCCVCCVGIEWGISVTGLCRRSCLRTKSSVRK